MSLPWFQSWLRSHIERHRFLGLPAIEEAPDFYAAWEDMLEYRHVDERVATAASIRMVGTAKPVRFHFEQLLKTAGAIAEKAKPEPPKAKPEYEPPPPPAGAELEECIATATGTTPLARNMRLELRKYIMDGDIDPRRIPADVLDVIAEEPEERPSVGIKPPRLMSVA